MISLEWNQHLLLQRGSAEVRIESANLTNFSKRSLQMFVLGFNGIFVVACFVSFLSEY